jgi:hypothetical protein
MVAHPVEIATRSFAKKGDAIEFFRAMLNRYKPDERVNDADALDLAALLERHPEYKTKVGKGIDHFEVMMTVHGSQCFCVARVDDSKTDFSFMQAVAGRAPSRKQEVSAAFRWAIRIDLYKARDTFLAAHKDADGLVTCAVTGERIVRDDGHMDHRPPMTFEVIVITFLAGRGLSIDDVPITAGQDNQVVPELTDAGLQAAFIAFHASVAKLDFVKKTVNLSQASKNRIRPARANIPST